MVPLENRALMNLNIFRCRTIKPSRPEQRISGVSTAPLGTSTISGKIGTNRILTKMWANFNFPQSPC